MAPMNIYFVKDSQVVIAIIFLGVIQTQTFKCIQIQNFAACGQCECQWDRKPLCEYRFSKHKAEILWRQTDVSERFYLAFLQHITDSVQAT